MQQNNSKTTWGDYLVEEYKTLVPLLKERGYRINADQPHIKGERFLMHALTTTSGKKLILLGTQRDSGKSVVIKATRDDAGKNELAHERTCRTLLNNIDFAYSPFTAPAELDYIQTNTCTISVQEYITQESSFLERTSEEQFTFALQAFKAQEGARATTHKHFKAITTTFGNRTSDDYITNFNTFVLEIHDLLPNDQELHKTLSTTLDILTESKERIEQYCGFLTHTDFVPHNFRINEGTMYLLDFSSLLFGNKHEGWARFLNFMTLHNPTLEQYLQQYLADNRAPEESESVHLMRLYRLGEIIRYYAGTLSQSSGDLLKLNTLRIDFWHQVLRATIQKMDISEEIRTNYISRRNELRSNDEKQRQKGLL